MRDAPAPHPGLLFFARAKKSHQKKGRPGWRDFSLRVLLREKPGAHARNLAVRGRAIRGPEKTTHLGPVLPLPSVLGEPLGARAAKPALSFLIRVHPRSSVVPPLPF